MQAAYALSDAEMRQHIEYLRSFSELVAPAEGPPVVLKDPNDDPVIYTAVAGAADVICTVDRHFYEPSVQEFCYRQGIQIVSDFDLLRTLREV
jgi:predicted nucleic acid-binding protein